MKHTATCNVTLGFSKGEICNCHGEIPVRVKIISDLPTVHKTRFSELGYWHLPGSPSLWQCVDLTGDRPAQVGTQYATEKELLANLEAYATEYGCDNANPKSPVRPIDRAYEGQAHYMSKAAKSLVNMLNGLDYSKFDTPTAASLTTRIHNLIKEIESHTPTRMQVLDSIRDRLNAGERPETFPVTRPDGQVVRATVPEREESNAE